MLSRQATGLERVQLGMQDTLLIVRMTLFCFVFGSEYYFHCLVPPLSIYVLYTYGVLYLPPAIDFCNFVYLCLVECQV